MFVCMIEKLDIRFFAAMQEAIPAFDIFSIIGAIVGIVGVSAILWGSGKWLKERYSREYQIEIRDCLHAERGGVFEQYIRFEIINNSTRPLLIEDIKFYDKKKREMKCEIRNERATA